VSVFSLIVQADHAAGGQVESIAKTFGVDWPHLTAQIVSFSIVCAVLYRLAYKPVLEMLEARRQQIAQGLANSERINAALAEIDAQRQRAMADARTEAARVITEAREIARRLQEQESQRAIATAEQILVRARNQVVTEHAAMLAELRHEVGHLVTQTAAAIIGKVLTPEDQTRLAEDATRHLTRH
jgi:F-type H+-transporting ATPase subunit b